MDLTKQEIDGLSFRSVRDHVPRKIIFLHGNSHSLDTFANQFVSPRLKDYGIIACDLCGHGSSKGLDSYSLINFADEITHFINELGLSSYVIVGHSLGGHIATHTLLSKNIKNKPSGILIYGTPPVRTLETLSNCFLPHPAMDILYKNDLSESELLTLVQSFHSTKKDFSQEIDDVIKVDPHFKATFMGSLLRGEYVDEISTLKNYEGQLAILHGEKDQLINLKYIQELSLPLWRQAVQIVKDSGHNIHKDKPDEFDELLRDFCIDTFI